MDEKALWLDFYKAALQGIVNGLAWKDPHGTATSLHEPTETAAWASNYADAALAVYKAKNGDTMEEGFEECAAPVIGRPKFGKVQP